MTPPAQAQLMAILKKKGIGPEGSKSLTHNELTELDTLLLDESTSLTTRATLLTALLLLEPNEAEAEWLATLRQQPQTYLPEPLVAFVTGDAATPFSAMIQRLIRRENLDEITSHQGMEYVLDAATPDYLKGAFLEGQRLKRETFTENLTFLRVLWQQSKRITVPVPVLIDLADSYDSYARTLNVTVFVAALLASAGFPTYVHGIDRVAPKEGITSHQVLKAAGKNPLKVLAAVAEEVAQPGIGWRYVDQRVFFPELFRLQSMRWRMVKRPFLATFEKLLQPLQAPGGNYLVTGYTHPHYRSELVDVLRTQGECRQALVVKGLEGATQLSRSRETVAVLWDGSHVHDRTVHPAAFGLPTAPVKPDWDVTAETALREGEQALQGVANETQINILYLAAVILTQFNLAPADTVIDRLRWCIESGTAWRHWQAGCQ